MTEENSVIAMVTGFFLCLFSGFDPYPAAMGGRRDCCPPPAVSSAALCLPLPELCLGKNRRGVTGHVDATFCKGTGRTVA